MKPCAIILSDVETAGQASKLVRDLAALGQQAALTTDAATAAGCKYVLRLGVVPAAGEVVEAMRVARIAGRYHSEHPWGTLDIRQPPPVSYRRDPQPEMPLAVSEAPPTVVQPGYTAVVLALYGSDPQRVAAVCRAIPHWANQDLRASVYCRELELPDGQVPEYRAALARIERAHAVHYTKIAGCHRHGDLFQKEALWNLAAADAIAGGARYLIFLDADVWSSDPGWWREIAGRLALAENAVVQGYRRFEDTEERLRCHWSLGSETDPQVRVDAGTYRHPGFCWAMPAAFWRKIGGWNPYCLTGSGDVCFVHEHLPRCSYPRSYWDSFRWTRGMFRHGQPEGRLDYARCDLTHENHGKFEARAYNTSREAVDVCGEQIRDMVELEPATGLLAWRNPKHRLRAIIHDKAALVDSAAVVAACRRHGLVPATHQGVWGWFDYEDCYREIVQTAPEDAAIVELGVFAGKSTVFLAQQIQNSGKTIRAFAFDVFPKIGSACEYYEKSGLAKHGGSTYSLAAANLLDSRAGHNVGMMLADMHAVHRVFSDGSLWAVWLDADHVEESTDRALAEWWPKVQPGGWFGGHDYVNDKYPGVRVAVDRFFGRLGLKPETRNISFVVRKPTQVHG